MTAHDGSPSFMRRLRGLLWLSVKLGARTGFHTVCELLKVMVPVMLLMTVLEVAGVLPALAKLFRPVMALLGLPGNAALVFISGATLNLYTAVAVAANVPLTIRQMTVLAVLCLDCHNLPVECAVQKKAGSGVVAMVAVRLLTGVAGALLFSWLIPDGLAWQQLAKTTTTTVETQTWQELVWSRSLGNGTLLLWVVFVVMVLMIIVEVLRQTGGLKLLTWLMRPLVWLAGLPREAAFTVMAASTLGLAFGAGLVLAEAREGHLSGDGRFRTNVFIGTTHSLVEDTGLFAVLGASIWWIVLGRLVIGALAVRLFAFCRRLYLRLQSFSVSTE